MTERIVVNASPLIILARAGRLELLTVFGTKVHVPQAVIDEISVHSDEAARLVGSFDGISTVANESTLPLVRSWDLGEGESAVLEWAQVHRPSRALLDDFAARRLAKVLSIPVTGTLGLALLAKRRGLIPEARPLISEFLNAGLYLSPRLVEQALSLVGESRNSS